MTLKVLILQFGTPFSKKIQIERIILLLLLGVNIFLYLMPQNKLLGFTIGKILFYIKNNKLLFKLSFN